MIMFGGRALQQSTIPLMREFYILPNVPRKRASMGEVVMFEQKLCRLQLTQTQLDQVMSVLKERSGPGEIKMPGGPTMGGKNMPQNTPDQDHSLSDAVRDLIEESQTRCRADTAAHLANLEAGTLAFLDALQDHVEQTHGYALQANPLWHPSDTNVDQGFDEEVRALIADARAKTANTDNPVTYGVEILKGLYRFDRARALASKRDKDTTD